MPARSHPARGAWIEIRDHHRPAGPEWSHPARGAWIEMQKIKLPTGSGKSHPARGAWIEIDDGGKTPTPDWVAPRKGCVD